MIEKSNNKIVKYSPEEILKFNTNVTNFTHVKTLDIALNEKCDSLALIKKKVGEKVSLAIIKVWIINLNDFLNIKHKMLPFQIDETSRMIFDEFYYFKISELSLIFKRIKTGYYGAFYESIDGMKLIDMFYKYDIERMRKFEMDNMYESRERKTKG